MNKFALVLFVLLASQVLYAEDIREFVKSESDIEKSIINPDESIYGIPWSISEDELIWRLGKPDGYLRLEGADSVLIYGKKHAFIFRNGKLKGLKIDRGVVDWQIANQLPSNTLNFVEWQLDNGIKEGSSLKSVKEILGEKLKMPDEYTKTYDTETCTVDLLFSHKTYMGEDDSAYELYGIKIEKKEN